MLSFGKINAHACVKIFYCLFLQDFKVAEDYGVTDFPILVYFENQVPNVFEGLQL